MSQENAAVLSSMPSSQRSSGTAPRSRPAHKSRTISTPRSRSQMSTGDTTVCANGLPTSGEDGETVVTVVRTNGLMRHTGLEAKLRWAVVWTLREGKAVRAHGYLTKTQALEAAGSRPLVIVRAFGGCRRATTPESFPGSPGVEAWPGEPMCGQPGLDGAEALIPRRTSTANPVTVGPSRRPRSRWATRSCTLTMDKWLSAQDREPT